jgi:hypothetical protein
MKMKQLDKKRSSDFVSGLFYQLRSSHSTYAFLGFCCKSQDGKIDVCMESDSLLQEKGREIGGVELGLPAEYLVA